MGALVTRALRPIKSFNIENRAHRVISREKPTPAPKFPQNIEDIKRTLEANPDINEKLDKKDEGLDNRLKDVYVTAHGRPEVDVTQEKKFKGKSKRPLPKDRRMPEEFDFGFKEPERVTYGRTTLRDAINFISAHQANPAEVTASKIALEYKLKVEDVESALKYFKTFEVYIPESPKAPAIFAGPAQMRKELYKLETKELEGNKDATVTIEDIKHSTVTITDSKDAKVNIADTKNAIENNTVRNDAIVTNAVTNGSTVSNTGANKKETP